MSTRNSLKIIKNLFKENYDKPEADITELNTFFYVLNLLLRIMSTGNDFRNMVATDERITEIIKKDITGLENFLNLIGDSYDESKTLLYEEIIKELLDYGDIQIRKKELYEILSRNLTYDHTLIISEINKIIQHGIITENIVGHENLRTFMKVKNSTEFIVALNALVELAMRLKEINENTDLRTKHGAVRGVIQTLKKTNPVNITKEIKNHIFKNDTLSLYINKINIKSWKGGTQLIYRATGIELTMGTEKKDEILTLAEQLFDNLSQPINTVVNTRPKIQLDEYNRNRVLDSTTIVLNVAAEAAAAEKKKREAAEAPSTAEAAAAVAEKKKREAAGVTVATTANVTATAAEPAEAAAAPKNNVIKILVESSIMVIDKAVKEAKAAAAAKKNDIAKILSESSIMVIDKAVKEAATKKKLLKLVTPNAEAAAAAAAAVESQPPPPAATEETKPVCF